MMFYCTSAFDNILKEIYCFYTMYNTLQTSKDEALYKNIFDKTLQYLSKYHILDENTKHIKI